MYYNDNDKKTKKVSGWLIILLFIIGIAIGYFYPNILPNNNLDNESEVNDDNNEKKLDSSSVSIEYTTKAEKLYSSYDDKEINGYNVYAIVNINGKKSEKILINLIDNIKDKDEVKINKKDIKVYYSGKNFISVLITSYNPFSYQQEETNLYIFNSNAKLLDTIFVTSDQMGVAGEDVPDDDLDILIKYEENSIIYYQVPDKCSDEDETVKFDEVRLSFDNGKIKKTKTGKHLDIVQAGQGVC